MLTSAMNNTKWDELRLAMYSIKPPPAWRTLGKNGYRWPSDREWYYHFREGGDGGYSNILHVDIFAEGSEHRELIRAALKRIHVPGEETTEGFRVFGYLQDGQDTDYI